MPKGATRSIVTTITPRRIGCALRMPMPATGVHCRLKQATYEVSTTNRRRCCLSSCGRDRIPDPNSEDLENRQCQHRLRQEADGEGERAKHRQAHGVDEQMRDAGPEIDRAGQYRPLAGIV